MPRFTEQYRIYEDNRGQLILAYEDDAWELHEDVIPDLLSAFIIARQRSEDWVIQLIDSHGNEIQRFTPHSYLFSIDGGVKDNPFYINLKTEGQEKRKIGPMNEVDLWVEDAQLEGLVPLLTPADPTFTDLGEMLQSRRLQLGLTQRDVARMAELSNQMVSDIENGKGRTIAQVNHLARVLDAYFEGPMPTRVRANPLRSARTVFDEVDSEHYRFFHGVPPDEVIEANVWIPGGMVLILSLIHI